MNPPIATLVQVLFPNKARLFFIVLHEMKVAAKVVWQFQRSKVIWEDMDEETCEALEDFLKANVKGCDMVLQNGRKIVVDFKNMTQTVDIVRPIRRVEITKPITKDVESEVMK